MQKLSRKQKYQEYREELKRDNEANSQSQVLNNYQNRIDQLQNQFQSSNNGNDPFEEEKVENFDYIQEENSEDLSEYQDLFDLLNEKPKVKDEEPIEDKPTIIDNTPSINEPVEPIVIDTTLDEIDDFTKTNENEIDNIVQNIDNNNSNEPIVIDNEPNIAELENFNEVPNVEPVEHISETKNEDSISIFDEFIRKQAEAPTIEPKQEEHIEETPQWADDLFTKPLEEDKKEETIEEKIDEPKQEQQLENVEPVQETPIVEIEEEPEEEPLPEQPVEETKEFTSIQEPDGIEIKNINELKKEDLNATLTDTIPFVIDDNAIKESLDEVDIEEDDEENGEVHNRVLNVVLIVLIIVLLLVLGLISYYILAGQGIIG